MLYAECGRERDFRRRAERLGKTHLGVFVERLVAQQDHQVLVPGVEEFLLERVVDRIAQVDAQNLRAERGRELPHGEGGGFPMQGGGGRFHQFFSRRLFPACRIRAFHGRSIPPNQSLVYRPPSDELTGSQQRIPHVVLFAMAFVAAACLAANTAPAGCG
jgi:hypothetical protein